MKQRPPPAANQGLAREQQRYQFLLQTAADGIHIVDRQGRLVEASDSFYRMLGYPPGTALKLADWDTQWNRAELAAKIAELIQQPAAFETRHRRSDGQVIDVEVSARGIEIDGEPLLYASSRDITQRKRAEAELRLSEEKLRKLYELSPLGIALTGMDGQFLDFNPAFRDICGYTEEELKVIDYWQLTPPEYAEQEAAQLESLRRSGRYGPYEKEYQRKDGRRVPLRLNGMLVQGRDGAPCIWSIIEDVTAQRAAENEIRRSNAELEQFAYAVSHDLRQPLRMVGSYLQLLGRALEGQLDADTRQCLDYALEGARRMDQMILSLLDYSKVGRKGTPMALLASREALDEALAFLGPEQAATGGTVTVAGEWPELIASHDELARLFQNLVGNALKYHAAGQRPLVEVTAYAQPAWLRVEVRDHGIGIAEGQAGRLFHVFSRLQSRARYEGSGIGLALCRKIVERHGGRIGVESAGEGRGSCFWFELPLPAADEAVVDPPTAPTKGGIRRNLERQSPYPPLPQARP
jgi:PAS domain S-box-containing protein